MSLLAVVSFSLGFVAASLAGWGLMSRIMCRRSGELVSLVARLRGGDFEEAPPPRSTALREAHDELRALAVGLRQRERAATQRENVLRALVEGAPMASVLLTNVGRILHANLAARELFFDGVEPPGGNFLRLLERAPEALRRAVAGEGDELFSIDDDLGTRQVYHLAKRHFEIAGQPSVLVVVNNLTRELHQQEAEVWKRMIRLISHELYDSLAPISSLVHSARLLSRGAPAEAQLASVFDTVAERADHVRSFLEGYAQFARLPTPRKLDVDWGRFVDGLKTLWPSLRVEGDIPETKAWFDPGQMQQVLINLLKNARESGGPEDDVSLVIGSPEAGAARFIVRDRGPGMDPEVMKNALDPFYSTKEPGNGLGLPLCREIVEAHGGVLRLQSRDEGGLDVVVRLPSRSGMTGGMGKLTLTRS
jgi:two-component system, NtrC family, nitrogen regulation sensor histidine kinase NtrY